MLFESQSKNPCQSQANAQMGNCPLVSKHWALLGEEKGLSKGRSSLGVVFHLGIHRALCVTALQFYYISIDPSPAASAHLLQLQEPCWEPCLFTQLRRISPVKFINYMEEMHCSFSL